MARKRSVSKRRVNTASKAVNASDSLGCALGGLILGLIIILVAFAIGLAALLFPLLLILMWRKCTEWSKGIKTLISVLVILIWLLLLPFVFQYFGWLISNIASDDYSSTIPEPTAIVQQVPEPTAIVSSTAINTPSPTPTAVPTNTPTATPTAEPTPSPIPVLKKGMNGEAVKQMQSQLKRLGYLQAEPDGDFGSMTETAVKDFQKKNGLQADGVAGSQTLTLMFSNGAKKQLWVWIPTKGGEKHHANQYCSDMVDPEYVKLEEAERRGFTPCGKNSCY